MFLVWKTFAFHIKLIYFIVQTNEIAILLDQQLNKLATKHVMLIRQQIAKCSCFGFFF